MRVVLIPVLQLGHRRAKSAIAVVARNGAS